MVYLKTWWRWWKPWANTLLYLPFNNNYNDESWNNNTMTLLDWSSPTYWTTSGWEKYATISNTKIWTYLNDMDISTWTVSNWVYLTTTSLCVCWFYWWPANEWAWWTWLILDANAKIVIFPYAWDIQTNVQITRNAWHNIVFTQWNWVTTVYVDWQSKYTRNWTFTESTKMFRLFKNPYKTNDPFVWNRDEVIVENKVRTAEEISDYYNQTKADYWL